MMDHGSSVEMRSAIRVLIADDHAIVRKGICALLATERGIEVVGEAQDGQDAMAKAQKMQPDVILMDLVMPGTDGLEATRRGGQYTQIGLFSGPFDIKFDLIAYKELRVTGSLGQRWTSWQRALALMGQGQVNTKSLVSHVLPITEWREAFRLFEEKQGLKIVLEPVD